jgi:hypothetical protein
MTALAAPDENQQIFLFIKTVTPVPSSGKRPWNWQSRLAGSFEKHSNIHRQNNDRNYGRIEAEQGGPTAPTRSTQAASTVS